MPKTATLPRALFCAKIVNFPLREREWGIAGCGLHIEYAPKPPWARWPAMVCFNARRTVAGLPNSCLVAPDAGDIARRASRQSFPSNSATERSPGSRPGRSRDLDLLAGVTAGPSPSSRGEIRLGFLPNSLRRRNSVAGASFSKIMRKRRSSGAVVWSTCRVSARGFVDPILSLSSMSVAPVSITNDGDNACETKAWMRPETFGGIPNCQ